MNKSGQGYSSIKSIFPLVCGKNKMPVGGRVRVFYCWCGKQSKGMFYKKFLFYD